MIVYIAGPISGQGFDEVVSRYKDKIRVLEEMGYMVYCPMTGKGQLRTQIEFKATGYDNYPVSTNHAIYERDRWMVRQADVILADLTTAGDRVSIGTMMELAWASMLGKHVIVVMEDTNIHYHAFVLEAAHIVFPTLDEAYAYLRQLAEGELEAV